MTRWLLRRTIESFERTWSYDASYLKEIAELSPVAAVKFALATSLGTYRRDVPLAAVCAAGITAVRSEDCGPCTQLAVAMAERQGVAPDVLRAVLNDDEAAMPDEVALAWRFTRATLAHDASADACRDEIVRRWGRRAVMSLAFAITTARMYPTVKYAMGHGTICSRVTVNGTPVTIDRALTSPEWRRTPGPSPAGQPS
jgi:alkylhydroperoxidase family enzyme